MEQLNLFEALYEKYKIKKHIRLIELFAGIGAQAKALENLGADFETWKVVEFDNNAIRSYNAIHNTNFEVSDIREIHAKDLDIRERERVEYIMTYSFPCQDLSLAGKTRGMSRGSGTRSGLLWEVERILNECGEELPQILLMENVPQVIGKKNIDDFKEWELFLESKGYQNYIQILNAKDYGIPQNRKRCFMVSILGDAFYEWPKKQPLKLKLKDMLEKDVDQKYIISEKMMDYLLGTNQKTSKFPRGDRFKQSLKQTNEKNIATTVTTRAGSRPIDNFIIEKGDFINGYNQKIKKEMCGTITTRVNDGNNTYIVDTIEKDEIITAAMRGRPDENGKNHQKLEIRDDGITNTITTVEKDNYLIIKEATKKGYKEAYVGDGVDISTRMETHRGTVQKGLAQTIKTQADVGVVVEKNLKQELCDKLIQENKVKENDVIRHSYSNERMSNETRIENKENHNCSPTLSTRADCLGVTVKQQTGLAIRKLTPKECYRLMGFTDDDYNKAREVNTESQLYKQAGNSIVVNVLMAIFKQLL